jgi:hypothetical protein
LDNQVSCPRNHRGRILLRKRSRRASSLKSNQIERGAGRARTSPSRCQKRRSLLGLKGGERQQLVGRLARRLTGRLRTKQQLIGQLTRRKAMRLAGRLMTMQQLIRRLVAGQLVHRARRRMRRWQRSSRASQRQRQVSRERQRRQRRRQVSRERRRRRKSSRASQLSLGVTRCHVGLDPPEPNPQLERRPHMFSLACRKRERPIESVTLQGEGGMESTSDRGAIPIPTPIPDDVLDVAGT